MSNDPPADIDILHAYWRMDYVTAPKTAGENRSNPFVDLPKQNDDRKTLIVYRGQYHYLILNRYPYNPGHLMVIPFDEIPQIRDLSPAARTEMMDLIALAQEVVTEAMSPDGFNIGINIGKSAGAGIPQHLHCHIVPRWNGDTNFISAIGKTRSLPQALDQTWEILHPLFKTHSAS